LLATQADAVPLLAAAQARNPGDFWLNFKLANALVGANKWDEAIGFYRGAIAVRPSAAAVYYNLGFALRAKGQLDEAIREYRKAIELAPKYALPHNNLGVALQKKGRLDEAIQEFRTAIELDPKYATPHIGLGDALQGQGRLDEAIREYRTAIELDHDGALPHIGLGVALQKQGQLDEAIREFHTAIELGPTDARPHNDLGNALSAKGRLDEAIREFRKASELNPKDATPHYNLGLTLLQFGRFTEAREATRRCLDLLPPNDPLRQQVTRQLQRCEQFLALDRKLPAILKGTEAPADDAERLALADLCQQPFQKRYAASARLFAEAFAHDAKLADDLQRQHRYDAACAAAQAGCGQGEDARALPDEVALGLRRQALDWLKADLAAYAKLAGRDDPAAKQTVRQRLVYWRQDADLAGVRDPQAVEKLPADERAAWGRLWEDVDALRKKVEEKK
jgi:Flp pilus assembly protein TadD